MDRAPVTSSAVVSVGYDTVRQILELEFVDGDVYQYYDVPQTTHKALLNAPSIGQFVNTDVKGRFRYTSFNSHAPATSSMSPMVVDEVEGNGEAGPSARRRRRDLQRTPDAFVTMDGHSGELEQLYHQLFGKYAGVMRPYVAKLYDPDGDTDMFLDPILYMSEYNST